MGRMISPWLALVTVLACARLTRLITRDSIFERPRLALINRLGPASKPAELLTCDWCMAVWVSACVVPAAWWYGDRSWIAVPLTILAAAHLVGLIATREDWS